jgi:hypothetical protein
MMHLDIYNAYLVDDDGDDIFESIKEIKYPEH